MRASRPIVLSLGLALSVVALPGCVLVITDEGISRADGQSLRLGDGHRHGKAERGLARDVRDAFDADPDLRRLDLGVSAEDGMVTLRGRVPDRTSFDKAIAVARATPGVVKVVSRLVVEID